MDPRSVSQVRRFNRTVTRRIGALDERFLGRGRPLAEARVLWEIGPAGCDIRTLRARLDLDSGYLSRLLRALEASALVVVEQSAHDRRVRTAQLTRAGLEERAVLDRRSDELAASLLEPLAPSERQRLVDAMGAVERLLTRALVQIAPVDPAHPRAQHCLQEYVAELDRRFAHGFDPARSISAEPDELRPPAGILLMATLDAEPIGCGALKLQDGAPCQLKRMWVAAPARGLGVGRRLLAELEACAARSSSRVVRLETNATLTEAIALYRSAGYLAVPPFNDDPYADHWFEKQLPAGG